jgi:uroporphyrinogen III methyltransferase/synthase
MPGKVFLVGAGPGDPGLITVKGLECIRIADVLIYDFLATPELLKHARKDAQVIYVGKKGGDHTLSQDGINSLIVQKAKEGFTVTRLKGGDPFVFGRGGEEAEVLVENGIAFEIVPGVTSAISAPAYAGIPLTHRDFTATVAFVTGHEDPEKAGSNIDWAALAKIGTLVFLMGVKNLPQITKNLMEQGKNPATPAALVRWGTKPEQQTLVGTLENIAQKAADQGLKPPAIFIVGEVVGLREKLNWFETRPLFGRRIVVTRSREQASDLVKSLSALGAECLEIPAIEITNPPDFAPLDEAIARLSTYQWLVFTSVNAVDRFFARVFEKGLDARALGNAKIAAIGPATAARLKNFGLVTDVIPKTYQAESVVEAFKDKNMKGLRILLPRALEARPVLPVELKKMGATVDEVAVYKTVAADSQLKDELMESLKNGQVDMVTFTSSSTVTRFADLFEPGALGTLMEKVTKAAIGPITADTARDLGLDCAVIAEEFTIPGLVEAIASHYSGRKAK